MTAPAPAPGPVAPSPATGPVSSTVSTATSVHTVKVHVPHPGTAFSLVAVGTAINTAHAVQQGTDTFHTLLAGGVYGIVCSVLDTVTGSNLGTALAALFLLSSFLMHGEGFVALVNGITGAVAPSQKATP